MRILVVDDDPTARLLMRAALRKSGFEVAMAVGGHDALRQFRDGGCDMVLLDVDMPDLSGHEVCVALRAEAGNLLPIVMVTGMDDVRSVEHAYESGATDFIGKPINWAVIGHRVRYLARSYQTLLELRAAEARNAAILQAIPDLVFEVDIDGLHVDHHASGGNSLFGPAERVMGKTVAEVLSPEAAQVYLAAVQAAHKHGFSIGKQISLQIAQDTTAWFELSVSRKATEAGQKPRFIVLSRDITERKEAEQRIRHLAFYDSLTGLPNRQSFLDRLDREIGRTRYAGGRLLGVLFMDLDGFKQINDTLGHSMGDLVLQEAADRLRQGLRPSDMVSRFSEPTASIDLARLGGDEFTALTLGISHPEDALIIAHRIRELMCRPFVLEGREVTLSTSIGIAIYPQDGENGQILLKHADIAMYNAKQSGRGNCHFYSASLTQAAVQRMEMEVDLGLALKREEFSLVYQPQFDVASERLDSVEALIRWKHPMRGMIPPLDFIPLAEATGLILPIGEWVLRTACSQAARWHREGHRLRIAVNLSPVQFRDPNLVQTVLGILAQTGLPADLLELEVTESTVMANTDAAMASLNMFRDCGVRIALDDFGTGYSSLSYLKRMPLSNLKIDRSFVNGLPHDRENHAIVRAILAMADSLGMSVTAEGVETIEQARMLKDMACDSLQGYFFSQPVPAANIPLLLSRCWSLAELVMRKEASRTNFGMLTDACVEVGGKRP